MSTPLPKPGLTFLRAFDVIMHNKHISASEKLVLLEVCRYWPKAYYGCNDTIAHNTGLSVRWVQKCLLALATGPKKRRSRGLAPRRAYIDRAYEHHRLNGKLYTVRVISPICLPGHVEAPDVPSHLLPRLSC